MKSQSRKAMLDLMEEIPVVGKPFANLLRRRGKWRTKLGAFLLIAVVAWWCFGRKQQTPPDSNGGNASKSVGANNSGNQIIANTLVNTGVINQVNGNQINNGISGEAMLAMLRDRSVAANVEWSQKYPKGYVLLGVADGSVSYLPNGTTMQYHADWSKTTFTFNHQQGTVLVTFPEMHLVSSPNKTNLSVSRCSLEVPYEENRPIRNQGFSFGGTFRADMYFEIIDKTRNIFLVGFKPY
jgi:hypothetical protein